MPDYWYEVTQTIKPSYKCRYLDAHTKYKDMTASEQFNWYKGMHEQIFWRDHLLESFCISEFHKNFNLHFHGIVLVPDTMTKLEIVDILKKCRKMGPITNFKPISNIDSWKSYIMKNQDEFPDGYVIESDQYDSASKIAIHKPIGGWGVSVYTPSDEQSESDAYNTNQN